MTRSEAPAARLSVRLDGRRSGSRRAGELVREWCAGRPFPPEVVDHAAVVAGALVANGLAHVSAPMQLEILVRDGGIEVLLRERYSTSDHEQLRVGVVRAWEAIKPLSASFGYRSGTDGVEVWALVRPTGCSASG